MNIYRDTIGEIVIQCYKTSEVFAKYGIDISLESRNNAAEACALRNMNVLDFEKEIFEATSKPGAYEPHYERWPLTFLADYIVNIHHKYVGESIPVVRTYLEKVVGVHGDKYPETIKVTDIFDQVANELHMHMMKEERVLFPFIKHLDTVRRNNGEYELPPFQTVKNPIGMMLNEHDSVEQLMEAIRDLTNNYSPPADACNTFMVCFKKLHEFDKDLIQHIHLENDILFKEAAILEEKFIQALR